jgi:hypothetical protein
MRRNDLAGHQTLPSKDSRYCTIRNESDEARKRSKAHKPADYPESRIREACQITAVHQPYCAAGWA